MNARGTIELWGVGSLVFREVTKIRPFESLCVHETGEQFQILTWPTSRDE